MKEYVEHQVKGKAEKFFRGAFKVFFMIIAAIVFLLLFGYGFMLLWNWLMPEVFGLPSLSYWQGVGILVMAKLLFGNFEGKGHKKHSKKGRKHFRNKMNDSCKSDFSKWEFYDKFWKEEGEKAFEAYVEREQNNEQGY
ncbi:hypothetical protein [Maribacter sp. 2308TA10-17]|uniref:hypothetical protein n=1 Tax=Maribacter sp. 2308TA10-17 TaxID=3386276 RepID=UPI0039BD716D